MTNQQYIDRQQRIRRITTLHALLSEVQFHDNLRTFALAAHEINPHLTTFTIRATSMEDIQVGELVFSSDASDGGSDALGDDIVRAVMRDGFALPNVEDLDGAEINVGQALTYTPPTIASLVSELDQIPK